MAESAKKPVHKKAWFWVVAITVALVVLSGAVTALNGGMPSKPVPDLTGQTVGEAEQALEAEGFKMKAEAEDGSPIFAKDQWEVTGSEPAPGEELFEGGTVTLVAADISDELEAEAQAKRDAEAAEYASAPVDSNTAMTVCREAIKREFPYGANPHWVLGLLADERQGDVWFIKVEADITNEYGAERASNIECHVGGTNGSPQLVDLLAY